MPLIEKVMFTSRLQRGNRIQVSRYVRWRYKLESTQYLSVWVTFLYVWNGHQRFLCRMSKDGRIVIPKLIMMIVSEAGKKNLEGTIVEVTLEPF